MTFGPSRPNITENKANMGRLVEARRASEAPEETSTERKEISPELKARLLAFDNAAHEYVMFMHDYYDKKDALWENSDREDELFSAEYISQMETLRSCSNFYGLRRELRRKIGRTWRSAVIKWRYNLLSCIRRLIAENKSSKTP